MSTALSAEERQRSHHNNHRAHSPPGPDPARRPRAPPDGSATVAQASRAASWAPCTRSSPRRSEARSAQRSRLPRGSSRSPDAPRPAPATQLPRHLLLPHRLQCSLRLPAPFPAPTSDAKGCGNGSRSSLRKAIGVAATTSAGKTSSSG